MAVYLVDNSVWQRASSTPSVTARLRRVMVDDLIITCPPQVLEYCHSARDPEEHTLLRDHMAAFFPAPVHPSTEDALALQHALWADGKVRAAGALDCLIAAYAVANDAILLHAERDYIHLAHATQGRVREEYVAP